MWWLCSIEGTYSMAYITKISKISTRVSFSSVRIIRQLHTSTFKLARSLHWHFPWLCTFTNLPLDLPRKAPLSPLLFFCMSGANLRFIVLLLIPGQAEIYEDELHTNHDSQNRCDHHRYRETPPECLSLVLWKSKKVALDFKSHILYPIIFH